MTMAFQIVAKFMQTAGLVLLLGPAFFFHALWRPHRAPFRAEASASATKPLRTFALGGVLFLLGGTGAQLARIVMPLVAGFPIDMQIRFGWSFITNSFIGRLQLVLLGLAFACVLLEFVQNRLPFVPGKWRDWVLPTLYSALAAGAIVAVALGGHAVSSVAPPVTVVAQGLHLGAAVGWSGGLLLLVALPWRRLLGGERAPGAMARDGLTVLSRLGFAAVLTILLSGLVLTLAYVFSLRAGMDSLYGRGLGAKIGLLGIIIGLAGINRLFVLPRLTRGKTENRAVLRRVAVFLRMEVAAVIIVLSVTAAVTQLPPPSTPGFMPGQSWQVDAGPFSVDVAIASESGADVRFDVMVRERDSGRALEADALEIHLDMPGHFMGIRPIAASATGAGTFSASSTLSMAGRWEAGVVIPAEDGEHVAEVGFQIASASVESYSRMQQLLMGYTGGAALLFAALFVTAAGLSLAASGTGLEAATGYRPQRLTGFALVVAGVVTLLQLGGVPLPGVPSVALAPSGPGSSAGGPPPSGEAPAGDKGTGGSSEAEQFRLWADVDEYLLKMDVQPRGDGNYDIKIAMQDYFGDPVPDARLQLFVVGLADTADAADSSYNGGVRDDAGRAQASDNGADRDKADRDENRRERERPAVELDVLAAPGSSEYAVETFFDGPGTWQLVARVTGADGAIHERELQIAVPVAGPKELLRLADEAMNRLQYLRIREEMRGRPGGTVVTDMLFAAPDRTAHRSDTGREMVVIGDTRYQRFGPEEPWRVGRWPRAAGFQWPDFDYANLGSRETLLRRDVVNDREVLVVSLIQDPPDIFYTLWIDAFDHRIHRLDMITTGHYMYWTFHDFDEPILIEAPVAEP